MTIISTLSLGTVLAVLIFIRSYNLVELLCNFQVGPSHFAFLLSDGRICRLPFSVISDRLDLSRANSTASSQASTIPLASASGSGAAGGASGGGGGGGSGSSKSAYKTPQASTAAASGTSE